uniref:Uncharacterized protein n=1 Tax=Sphaerodactylus townsendi TaxID=933632 RepID=A0ACB8ESU6_9SAUR
MLDRPAPPPPEPVLKRHRLGGGADGSLLHGCWAPLGTRPPPAQSTLRYNQHPEKRDTFALDVETLPKECNRTTKKYFDIHLQVSYTGERERSNMVLIEVEMLSGHIPVKKSVKRLLEKPLVKKVEFDPDKVIIYLDELDNTEQCYTFSAEQEFEVKDLKSGVAKVYDYYNPGQDYSHDHYSHLQLF